MDFSDYYQNLPVRLFDCDKFRSSVLVSLLASILVDKGDTCRRKLSEKEKI